MLEVSLYTINIAVLIICIIRYVGAHKLSTQATFYYQHQQHKLTIDHLDYLPQREHKQAWCIIRTNLKGNTL